MTDSAVHEFFSNGCQYYIAGRYGAFAGLNTVVGNLLHHAIEHFLKGVLAKTKSLKELKKLLHNLPAIWDAFKAQVNDPTLARFDDVISRLHKFEDLRYPDPNEPGMLCHIELTKARAAEVAAMIASTPTSTLPQYDLILEETDELVAVIFAAASLEPKAYFGAAFRPPAWEYIVKDNMVRAIVDAVPSIPARSSRKFSLGERVTSATGRLLINTIDDNTNDPDGPLGTARGWADCGRAR
jgi:hypothetical protein